jgi:hypothetical protein
MEREGGSGSLPKRKILLPYRNRLVKKEVVGPAYG